MKISEISPTTLRAVGNAEILSLHRRLHELWAQHFAESQAERANGLVREDVWNAHQLVVEEMMRRDLQHDSPMAFGELALPERLMVVPAFVSLAGSTVARGAGQADVDVVVRSDQLDEKKLLIWSDNVFLPLRKVLDPDKSGRLHYILNPQGPHAEHVPLYDLMLVRRTARVELAEQFTPITRYAVQKPLMLGYTDFVDLGELWEKWVRARLEMGQALLVSPKVDGFRTILQKAGERVSIFFADAGEDRAAALPTLAAAMQKVERDFVIEGELQAHVGERYVARPQLLTLLAGELNAMPMVFLYDLLYDGEDLHVQPFAERMGRLKKLAALLGEAFVVLPQLDLQSREGLAVTVRAANDWQPPMGKSLAVEGVVVREASMPYTFGATDRYAKLKRFAELKVKVLAVHRKEHGYTYSIALRDDDQDVPVGDTFVSKERLAAEGETLNVGLEELILYPDGRVATGKPRPLGPDKTRPAYTVAQAIDLARRFGVLKEIVEARGQHALTEDETRAEAAAAFWKAHWFESFPPGGKGVFVYQHHWRGLPEDLKDADEKALLETDHSVHGDLRLSFGPALWGFTVFLGTTADVRGGRDLWTLPPDDALQGTFKLHQPKAWLTVARQKPYLSAPGGVGGTSQKWAKFFEQDHGAYEVGMWREHSFEIFLHGKKLRGRFLITFAPMGGRRVWVIRRPSEQTPLADSEDRERLIAELRQKRQLYLLWAKPGSRPELIKLAK